MSKTGKKVLIVDDMPTILDQAKEVIGDRYDVDTAQSDDETLQKIGSFRPDIILMDMHMPGTGGIACMENVHAIPEFKDIPVIFTINDVSVITRARAYDHGAADFIKKPFIASNLFRKIDMHIKLAEIGWRFEP